ncbi:malate synthase, partial [Sarracenia purpurea var. burkii]
SSLRFRKNCDSNPEIAKILTKDALRFITDLQREFRNHVRYAMKCREEAHARYDVGVQSDDEVHQGEEEDGNAREGRRR